MGAFNRCRDCYATEQKRKVIFSNENFSAQKGLRDRCGKHNCGRSDLFPEGKNQVSKIKSQLKTFSDQLMAGDRICAFHIGQV
jgi:hypothetical protein